VIGDILVPVPIIHHKRHMGWSGKEPGLHGKSKAKNYLSHDKIFYTTMPRQRTIITINNNNMQVPSGKTQDLHRIKNKCVIIL
jgi:hypothetical protein